MGVIVRFPVRRHARASSRSLKPKTEGDASRPFSARASRNRSDLSLAILPRAFQFEIAVLPTPASARAAFGPPTASMTASTESSIAGQCSQYVNMSTVHILVIEKARSVMFSQGMAESSKSLANRLKITREALDISPADLCKAIRIKPNRWSQYENGERRITVEVANKLCDEFGLSLDWIYRANPAQLPHALRLKIRQVA